MRIFHCTVQPLEELKILVLYDARSLVLSIATTNNPSVQSEEISFYVSWNKQTTGKTEYSAKELQLVAPRGTRNLSLSIYFRYNFPRKRRKIKKKKAYIASLDSVRWRKKIDRIARSVPLHNGRRGDLYLYNLFLTIKIDRRSLNPGVARRFTRVSCNDKLSPRASFPSFAFPSDLEETILYVYTYTAYALTFQQREGIFPRDLDPRTRWNPVTGYPVSPILAAPDYSLKPNTRRQTIPHGAFSVYFSLEESPDVSFFPLFDADFSFWKWTVN